MCAVTPSGALARYPVSSRGTLYSSRRAVAGRALLALAAVALTATAANCSAGDLAAAESGSSEEKRAQASPARTNGSHSLILGAGHTQQADVDRMGQRTAKALDFVSCLESFECRIATEMLSCTRSAHMVIDGPFQDVLMNVPVRGTAHVEGLIQMRTVPNTTRAVVDLHVEGTVGLQGVGQSRGVRIDSDGTTRFHAVKRLELDRDGMRAHPATCQATTTMETRGISTNRPKLLGRFAERVAEHKISDNRAEAEAECSEHVAEAIAATVDREVNMLIAAANESLDAHLQTLAGEERKLWNKIQFQTSADGLVISRRATAEVELAAIEAEAGKPLPAIVLRLPRAKFDLTRLLGTAKLLGGTDAKPTDAANRNAGQGNLKPAIAWEAKAMTVSFDYEPIARLASEAPVTTVP